MRRMVLAICLVLALVPLAAQVFDLESIAAGGGTEYSLVQGDTLKGVAAKSYGDYRLWPILWYLNRDALPNPERVETGTVLNVGELPFTGGVYNDLDNALISSAYARVYDCYVELGSDWADQRHWVLIEALQFSPGFATEVVLPEEDLAWYIVQTGVFPVADTEAVVVEDTESAIVTEPEPEKAPVSITFLETSDVHGAIFPYNFITAKPAKTSLAQVSTLVNEIRTWPGNNLVLLDDGDTLQGQPTVYYYNFEKTEDTHIWSDALNYMGYDVVGVANHDIEAGHPVYDKLYQEIMATTVCANAVKEDGTPYFTPYTIIDREGIRIAVLGLITPKIPDWLPPQFWTGMEFMDMVETAKKWVPIIMEEEKPDVLIGLFHAGVDYTYGGVKADTPNNENAAQLVAEQVPGFDLLFVGHDHQGWDGLGYDPATKGKKIVTDPDGKVVPIFGSLAGASKVPVARLDLTWNAETGAWDKKVVGSLLDVSTYAADPAFIERFQPAFDEVRTWVDRPVGQLAGTITTRDSMFGDSAFVDLIHRIQLELSADPAMGLMPAQISFAAPLTFDATIPSSPDGTMYVRDMFNLYQYENFLYTMDMTGQQIKDFLEYSYKSWFDTMPNEGNHLIAFVKDKDGKLLPDARTGALVTATRSYNYDSAAGINYTVAVTKAPGSRIEISTLADGTAFDLEATYTVAINSYRGSGGGAHLTTGAGMDKATVQSLGFVNGATTKDLRYYLLKWFEAQTGAVTVDPIGNWQVIPEDLAAQGKETDWKVLYPSK